MQPPDVLEDYGKRGAEHRAIAATLETRVRRAEWLRLTAFLLLALLIIGWFDAGVYRPVVAGAAILAAVAFFLLVGKHQQLARRARDARDRAELCARGSARVLRAWGDLPAPALTSPPDHPFAADLSVTGGASLAQLLDVVSAAPGRAALAEWLLATTPPPVDEIVARQEAAAELRSDIAWREQAAMYAMRVRKDAPARVAVFLEWAEAERWLLPAHRSLLWLGRATAFTTVISLIGFGFSGWFILPFPIILAANGIVTLTTGRRLHALLDRAALRADDVESHLALVRHAEALTAQSPRLQRLGARLRDGGAATALARLDGILSWSEVRHNSVLYPIVQLLLLFDVHLLAALERWQLQCGAETRDWFDALGEIEALSALATLSYENPDWPFPRFVDDTAIRATALGHPLLSGHTRVPNDAVVGPRGKVLIITGSNMAGKTTLIRAIGANVVLANAGAPVCAQRLTLPRLRVRTSMHIRDSLEGGLSLFAAELRRIRMVVDAALESSDAPVLFLLDELLRGTNAEERRIAVATVLRRLLDAGAIGAITTHDLSLGREPILADAAVDVHFREYFEPGTEGPVMRFDYTLKPGPAGSSNALALLRMVGLAD